MVVGMSIRDRRIKYRWGLNRLYAPYYDSLCELLSTDWQPISGFRSFEEQRQLFEQGRTTQGPIVTRAKPGLSMHNYGLASDWAYFPSGVYTPIDASSPQWSEYIDACEKVGVQCLSWERPHNQLVIPCTMQRLYALHVEGGMDAVNSYLRTVLNGPSNPTSGGPSSAA